MNTDWTSLISQVGFPIFVAAYLLLRNEKKLENFTAAITRLENVIARVENAIQKLTDEIGAGHKI